MERIEKGVIEKLKGQGMLQGVNVRQSGAADKLTVTAEALQWNFVLAAIIAYLLMSA
nr:hypothetical protein [Desulfobacterales bacterium]